jgi:GT2 family glycosyltransferase
VAWSDKIFGFGAGLNLADSLTADVGLSAGGSGGVPEQAGLISIVIATKNRKDSLDRLLRSLQRQDYRPCEIVVVDDGSEPPLELGLPDIRSFRNPESLGATAARNSGINHAAGEFIAIFDDDVEISDPTLLTRSVALTRKHSDWGVIAFRQLSPGGATHYMQPASVSALCYAGQFFAYGSLLRTAALRRVGAFEPAFGYYYEEMELSLRLFDAGYSVIYDPSLFVMHYQDERGRDQIRIYRLMLRNTILTGLLRCPWWCMPAIMFAAITRHVRWTANEGRIDFSGIGWSVAGAARLLRYVRTNRKPIRFATLQKKRRLTRRPQPISE